MEHRKPSQAVAAVESVLPITRFSQLGEPPEAVGWWRPVGIVFVVIPAVLITVVVGAAALPLVLLFTLARRLYFCRVAYHTHPKEVKIAIIGGGWSGCQSMARLKELGVAQVTGFERHDALGGTWHPSLRYHSLQVHGAMWITSFAKYPYHPTDRDVNDGKVSGEETQAYVQRFADDKGLNEHYHLSTKVLGVKYDSAGRTATLTVAGPNGEREEGPFDLVIFASQASEPNIPEIPGIDQFGGKVLHTTQFKREEFDEIVAERKKVVVVGGSRAGCDMALCFSRAGYDNMKWVYRTPYLFWKYELMFHNRSLLNMLRGLTTLVALLWALLSKTIAGGIMWCSGLAVTYGKPHNDWNKFHFGILCPRQRRDLSSIPDHQVVVGDPKRFTPDGFEMASGQKVAADVVIFGTGCQSGIDKLVFQKDGAPYALSPTANLLHHFIVPDFPVFSNSTALWTTFGPVRAVNSADMAIYHLCVRKKLSEAEMAHKAARQLGRSPNAISGWLFQSYSFALRIWLVMHLDLIAAGLLDFFDFMWHAIQVFTLSEQDPLKLRILPGGQTAVRQRVGVGHLV